MSMKKFSLRKLAWKIFVERQVEKTRAGKKISSWKMDGKQLVCWRRNSKSENWLEKNRNREKVLVRKMGTKN